MKLTQIPAATRRLLRAAMPSTPPPRFSASEGHGRPTMMRASAFRLSPLLLLAAAMVALAVLLVHDTPPAAADHGDGETHWSATLTVKVSTGGNFEGCTNGESTFECGPNGALTDDDFTFRDTEYEVQSVFLQGGLFFFELDKELPELVFGRMALEVGDTQFRISPANVNTDRRGASLTDTGLSWTAGDTVNISLVTVPSPVSQSGVELSTETLAVTEGGSATFTIALSADPGTDATVNLVKTQYFQSGVGADDHRWNVNAATVAPETLTFTAGTSGNWGSAQTVTVTAPQDDDSCSEQLVILVLSPTQRYGYVYVGEGNGGYDLNAQGDYVWVGAGEGEYNRQLIDDYDPVGGTSNSVTGVSVTVADDDGGSCGGV